MNIDTNTISKKPKYLKNIWKILLFLYSGSLQAITISLTLLDNSSSMIQDSFMFIIYATASLILLILMVYLHINRRQTFEHADKEHPRTRKIVFSMRGEKIGIYLRFGVILIGLFSLIYIILSNAQIIVYKSECINSGLIMSSTSEVTFFVLQAIFILKYHSIIILRHKKLIQFGLFNIIMVNILTWEISCLSKISYGGSLIVNSLNCTIKALNGFNLYFLPAVSEYSVIGLAIMFEILNRGGKESLIETESENGSMNFIEKTKKSIYGCLIGSIIVLVCIGYTIFIILIDTILHVKWVFYAHCSEECFFYMLSIIFLSLAFSKTKQLKFSFSFLKNNIDKNLLYISAFLSAVFSIMITTYCFFNLTDGNMIMRAFTSLLEIFQIYLQTIVLQDSLFRCSKTMEQHHDKPGQHFYAILIGINFGLWIFKSFQLKNGDIFFNKYQNVIQNNVLYSFILYVTLPFSILYRYHSSACFANAFTKIYQREVDRFEGVLRVEGYDSGQFYKSSNKGAMSPQNPDPSRKSRSQTLPSTSSHFLDDINALVPNVRRDTIINFEAAKLRVLSSQMSQTIAKQKLSPFHFKTKKSLSKISTEKMLSGFISPSNNRRHSNNELELSTTNIFQFQSIPNSPNINDGDNKSNGSRYITRSVDNLSSEAPGEKLIANSNL